MIGRVAKPEAVKPAPYLLEERDQCLDVFEAAQPGTRHVAAAAVGPELVALFMAGGHGDDLGQTLRPA